MNAAQELITTKIRLTRAGDQYEYRHGEITYVAWKFESAYGDKQWGLSVEIDGAEVSYSQADTLSEIRTYIANDISRATESK